MKDCQGRVPAVSALQLNKQYGKQTILKDITFQADFGECIGIFGENGCGKSTLLSILSGARRPSSGTLLFSGEDALSHPSLFQSSIGYLPQENPLIDRLSVMDNLSLWYGGGKKLKKALTDGLPCRFGLDRFAKQPVFTLSGGLKKRLSLACALANDPQILIMDEPTAALDLVCKAEIRAYLTSYLAHGGLVILTTHEDSEFSLCTRSFLMEGGVLLPLENPIDGSILLSRMGGHHE